ncbi:VWA domain-containing protein [Nocardioides sp. GY 10113]|uniref:type II secretion system F family protein n=1 Tax=Nocardioides sp. GY 10113 TaxID=2569761 RepID=UPI0010A7F322|nr:type II secretion system F family protein [Nocardioides sp. GY 10113]TIC81305.1 VWA domain-containing protein [Nocardioides sp. GY 10113]
MTGRSARRARLVPVGAAVGAAAALALAGPATAADGGLDIDHVEVAPDGTVSAVVGIDAAGGAAASDLATVEVTVDGEAVDASAETIAAGDVGRTTVLAIDASDSMRGARLAAAEAAALAFLDAAPADVRIGLVTFADRPQQVVAPTTDHGALAEAIGAIELTRGTHVYDAVASAVALAGDDGARSVLLLSDGRDQGGGATLDDAVAAATGAGVVVDVVALDGGAHDRAALAPVAAASGGDVVPASAPGELEALFTAQADALAHQVLVTFPRPDGAGAEARVEVALTLGAEPASDAAFVPLGEQASGGATRGSSPTRPLVGPDALLLGAGALGLGLAGILAVVLAGRGGPTDAQRRIAALLGEGPATPSGPGGATADGLRASAVGAAERVVRGDFGARLAQRLTGAAVSFTPAEWVLLNAGTAVAAATVGFAIGGAALAVLALAGGAAGPEAYLRFRHSRRLRAFAAQLPETLTLMSGGLSAGLSLAQAVDTVVREGQEPMAGELRRALAEHRLGVGIEDALDGVADRMGSEDFAWLVMAVRIQREVGGNLAEILTTVAETLREREYLRRQVQTLSAEGRLSAWILGALPVAMLCYMLVANRDFARPLYTEALGLAFLGGAAVLLAVGAFVMSRMVKVEV